MCSYLLKSWPCTGVHLQYQHPGGCRLAGGEGPLTHWWYPTCLSPTDFCKRRKGTPQASVKHGLQGSPLPCTPRRVASTIFLHVLPVSREGIHSPLQIVVYQPSSWTAH